MLIHLALAFSGATTNQAIKLMDERHADSGTLQALARRGVSGVCSLPVMLRDFLFAEPEKASSVIVENVTLLLRAQERRIFDGLNGHFNGTRPYHLVRTPHNPFLESRVNEPLELAVETLT
jgi:phospholipase C